MTAATVLAIVLAFATPIGPLPSSPCSQHGRTTSCGVLAPTIDAAFAERIVWSVLDSAGTPLEGVTVLHVVGPLFRARANRYNLPSDAIAMSYRYRGRGWIEVRAGTAYSHEESLTHEAVHLAYPELTDDRDVQRMARSFLQQRRLRRWGPPRPLP